MVRWGPNGSEQGIFNAFDGDLLDARPMDRAGLICIDLYQVD